MDDAVRADDVAALVALVEKMEKRQRQPSGSSVDDGAVACTRQGENLLAHARAYLTAVTSMDGIKHRAFHGAPGSDRSYSGDANEDASEHNLKASGRDMTTPASSPPPESVLVGVLKRENASLIAKVRRLEEEAKRMDDKTTWGDEHLARRLKSMEIQCAEAVAEKNRLEVEYAAERARVDDLRAVIAQLSGRLAETESALCQAKTTIMEAQLTRAKRSDTMETSGTDSDGSESPTRLSLRDLAVQHDSDHSNQAEARVESAGNQRDKAGHRPRTHSGESTNRRRPTLRRRGSIGSISSDHRSVELEAVRSCSRPRCESSSGEKSSSCPTQLDKTRRSRRSAVHPIAPPCPMGERLSLSTSRYRSHPDAPPKSGPYHQSNQQRPRWKL